MEGEFFLVKITSRESVPVITVTLLIKRRKQTAKFTSAKFEKKNVSSKLYRIENSKTRGENSVNQDKAAHAHDELPHQDLLGLQSQLFCYITVQQKI